MALACVGCWAAAAGAAAADGAAQEGRGPEYAPGRVLVRLRQTQTSGAGTANSTSTTTSAAAAGAAVSDASLPPGLQLERLVGQHHAVPVPPPPAGKRFGAATASTRTGSTGSELPTDAVRLFRIIDGSSVDAKLAELRAHPGAGLVSPAAAALAQPICSTCTAHSRWLGTSWLSASASAPMGAALHPQR